jgi:hypothetical protein
VNNSTRHDKQAPDQTNKGFGAAADKQSFTSLKLDWMTALMAYPRLDARAKVVCFCIAQHTNEGTGKWPLSDEQISEETGIPKRWVQRARSAARAEGWIDWKRSFSGPNTYWPLSTHVESVLAEQRRLAEARKAKRFRPPYSPPVAIMVSPPVANSHLNLTPEKDAAAIASPSLVPLVPETNTALAAAKRAAKGEDAEIATAATKTTTLEAKSASTSPDVDYYRRAAEIFGASSSGLARKLLAAKQGNVALARAALEVASTKHNAREYLSAIIRQTAAAETAGPGPAADLQRRLDEPVACPQFSRDMYFAAAEYGYNIDDRELVESLFERFRAHHQAKGSKFANFADWKAEWKGWIANQAEIDAKTPKREDEAPG